jgi:hypothetical protein
VEVAGGVLLLARFDAIGAPVVSTTASIESCSDGTLRLVRREWFIRRSHKWLNTWSMVRRRDAGSGGMTTDQAQTLIDTLVVFMPIATADPVSDPQAQADIAQLPPQPD